MQLSIARFGLSTVRGVWHHALQFQSTTRAGLSQLKPGSLGGATYLMRVYEHSGTTWFCGHWNSSPIEIGVTPLLRAVPDGEVRHLHDYCEYYVILEGSAELEIEGRAVPLRANTIVMVEPGERHRIVAVGSNGVRWVIVKQRSEPNSKHIS